MKTPSLLPVVLVLSFASSLFAKTPVNVSADAGARRIVDRIEKLQAAGYTLSGQQIGFEPWIVDQPVAGERVHELNRVSQLTGKFPAILALDLNTCYNHPARRESLIRLAKAHAAAGGIVSISWHEANPRQDNPDAGAPNTSYSSLNALEWNRLVNYVFTQEFANWFVHLQFAAAFLGELGNAGVPVLWRPYHEAEGGWFWWGQTAENTPANYRALWSNLFQRFSGPSAVFDLQNLVWVYSASFPGQSPTFPGTHLVDFAGFDFYTNNANDPLFVSRDNLVKGFGAVPSALTETGLLPSNAILYPGRSARYAWVTIWYGGDLDRPYYGAAPSGTAGNTPATVQAFYGHPRTVDRASVWNILERKPVAKVLGKKTITVKRPFHNVRVRVGQIPYTTKIQQRATRNPLRNLTVPPNLVRSFRVRLKSPTTVVRVRAVSSSEVPSGWQVVRIRKSG